MNPEMEDACEFSKKYDEEMKSSAKTWEGCKVKNMKNYVLADLCITLGDKSLPDIVKCRHDGVQR